MKSLCGGDKKGFGKVEEDRGLYGFWKVHSKIPHSFFDDRFVVPQFPVFHANAR
jgi:hypothetical protein